MMQKFPVNGDGVPEPLRAHAKKVQALAVKVAEMINGLGEQDTSVLLDVLLNVYVNAGISYGREVECASRMVQIGGQILLADAIQQQAGGITAPAATTRH